MSKSKRSAEKEAYWQLVFTEFATSGLPVRAFCAREGLSEPSFYAWRRKLRNREVEASHATKQPTELIPVDVVNENSVVDRISVDQVDGDRAASPAAAWEVLTPGGFTLRFAPEIEPRQLTAVLGAIGRCEKTACPGGATC
jgi:hypothetical protein